MARSERLKSPSRDRVGRGARVLAALGMLVVSLGACEKSIPGDRAVVVAVASPTDAAPPLVVSSPAPSAAPVAAECAHAEVGDAIASRLLPLGTAGYCIDRALTKTYGVDATYRMDMVCTTLLDGECEVYFRHGLQRLVAASYVSTAHPAITFRVLLSRFKEARGAQALLAARLDGFPDDKKPKAIGASIFIGTDTAYVCRGQHVAELRLESDDARFGPIDVAALNEAVSGVLTARIDERLK